MRFVLLLFLISFASRRIRLSSSCRFPTPFLSSQLIWPVSAGMGRTLMWWNGTRVKKFAWIFTAPWPFARNGYSPTTIHGEFSPLRPCFCTATFSPLFAGKGPFHTCDCVPLFHLNNFFYRNVTVSFPPSPCSIWRKSDVDGGGKLLSFQDVFTFPSEPIISISYVSFCLEMIGLPHASRRFAI